MIFFSCYISVMEYYVGVKNGVEMNRDGLVVYMCNPNTCWVEAGGLPWILDQLRLPGNYQGAEVTKQCLTLYYQIILSDQPSSRLVKEQCTWEEINKEKRYSRVT